jgi:malate dehydrogenase
MKLTVLGGGGWVGSAAAFYIAALRLADEILLVGGRRTSMTEQHAFDLCTAVAPLGVRVSAGSYDDLAGSHVVINAAGVPHTADSAGMLTGNIVLLREIAGHIRAHCPEAVIITATNPVDPLNYATWRTGGFARRQVVGYSLNDSFRFRGFVAAAKGVQEGEVEAAVLGEHGPAQVPLFSSVRIAGKPVSFTEEEEQSIRGARREAFKRVEVLQGETGRTMGWTCAIGLAQMMAAVVGDTGEIIPCSAVLDGEYGFRGLSMGVPVRLGRAGIREIVEFDLVPDERAALAECAAQMKSAAEEVDAALSGD